MPQTIEQGSGILFLYVGKYPFGVYIPPLGATGGPSTSLHEGEKISEAAVFQLPRFMWEACEECLKMAVLVAISPYY